MNSPLFETIRKNYILGYGMPPQFYTGEQLEKLLQSGLITELEYEKLLGEKRND